MTYRLKNFKLKVVEVMTDLWILTGSPKIGEIALSQNIWGVKESLKNEWKKLQKGDLVVFYASSLVGGVIRVGKVKNKFKQDLSPVAG